MSLKSVLNSIIGTVKPILKTEADKAIAAIKNSPQGQDIMALVHAAEQTGKSGPQKMVDVLANAAPIILTLVKKGGVQAEIKDVETLARSVVESFVADLKSANIAAAILKALGL